MSYNLLIIIFSFLISYKLYKKFISLSSSKFLDIPNQRSMHSSPIPRGGGIIFSSLTIFSSIIYLYIFGYSNILIIPISLIPLCIVGLFDDLYSLKPIIKYLTQFIISIFLFFLGDIFINLNLTNHINIILFFLIIIFFTGIINFINFMDGIDGLVASCMLVSISTSCIILGINNNILFLLGSLLSFTIFNWQPAKLFMGDIGSTFLAAINIGLITQSSNLIEALGLLLILTPFLLDPFVCIIRRYLHGQNIFKPHRLHLYQRLKLAGMSDSKICIIYISSTLLFSIGNIFFNIKFLLAIFLLSSFVGLYLDQQISEPFIRTLKKASQTK